MHVEIIGCTSAGKSTLLRGIEEAGRERHLALTTGDELALGWAARLARNEFLRRRLVDGPALVACLVAWRRRRELIQLALRLSRSAPGAVSRRLNLARNALRKIGLFEIVARRCRPAEIAFVDNEGVLQAAHNLFVHTAKAAEVDDVALAAFLRLAPLPEAVVYVRQPEAVLLERTLKRGHKRVEADSAEAAGRFVRRAVQVFDAIAANPAVRPRLLFVDPGWRVSLAAEAGTPAELAELHRLVAAGASLAAAERARVGRP